MEFRYILKPMIKFYGGYLGYIFVFFSAIFTYVDFMSLAIYSKFWSRRFVSLMSTLYNNDLEVFSINSNWKCIFFLFEPISGFYVKFGILVYSEIHGKIYFWDIFFFFFFAELIRIFSWHIWQNRFYVFGDI